MFVRRPFMFGCAAFAALACTASAQTGYFSDNFNRANVGPTTLGSDIGPNYVISSPTLSGNPTLAPWQITGDTLTCAPGSIPGATLVNTGVNATGGLGNAFTVSANMSSPNAGYMGLALNYQDQDDYYAVRLQPGSSLIDLIYVSTTVASFSDDFARANTGLTTNGSIIGVGYVISTPALPGNSGTAAWQITNNALASAPGANSEDTIINNTITTNNGLVNSSLGNLRNSFTLSGEMTTTNSGFMGLALNYQDANDFYAIRITPGSPTIQLLYVKDVGGTVSTAVVASATLSQPTTAGTVTMTIVTGDMYKMTVHSGSSGSFTYTVRDETHPMTVSGTLTDPSPLFSGGYGGFYGDLAAATFDNISIAATVPATGGLGSATLSTPAGATMTIAANDVYTLSVTSSAVGQFSFVVTDVTNYATASGTLSDSSARFRGGNAGVFVDLAAATFYDLTIAENSHSATDNFNRANTSATTTGSILGWGYVISTPGLTGNSGTSTWQLSSNALTASPGTNVDNTVICNDVLTENTSSQGFTISGLINNSGTGYCGLVANYQDTNDFYAIRISPGSSTIDLAYVENSGGVVSTSVVDSSTLTTPQGTSISIANNQPYTLSITSNSPGVFTYVLTYGESTLSTGSTATGTLTDTAGRFTGGYGGVFADTGSIPTFDNLNVATTNSVVHDDFDRADTSPSTTGATIGSGYLVSTPDLSTNSGVCPWQISSGTLAITPTLSQSSDTLIYYSSGLTPTAGVDYTVSGTLIPSNGDWMGLALDYQDADDFYAVRIEGGSNNLQLIYVQQSGSSATLALAQGVTLPFSVPANAGCTMKVTTSSAGVFSYTVTSGSNSASGTLTDAGHRFSGGFSGYYAGTAVTAKFGPIDISARRELNPPVQYLSGDPQVQAGVNELDAYSSPTVVSGPVQWTTANGTPTWTFIEFNNVVALYPTVPTAKGIQSDGSYLWQSDFTGPSGTFYPLVTALNLAPAGSAASANYDLELEVNSLADFDNTYWGGGGQPWAAAYCSARIGAPGGSLNRNEPSLADLKSLKLSLKAAIPYQYNDVTGSGYDPSKHLSHMLLFITVQNLNGASPGYGDYLWFGIELYNDEKTLTTLHTLADSGTGKWNYNVGMAPFAATDVGNGGSTSFTTISGDLLPLIKMALQSAWNAGYLSGSANLADYQIGGYQIGWEITGLATVQCAVKDQSLIGTW